MTSPTIHFITPGEFDLRSLTIMGLSAKDSTSAIGEFGTGLKYAIATLLRTGHEITISQYGEQFDGCVEYKIIAQDAPEFRGKKFKEIRLCDGLDSVLLPFTTDLGPKWEPWMAYRELACNTLDEKGYIELNDPEPAPGASGTVISVTGSAIWSAYLTRNSIILSSSPIAATDILEVHSQPSNSIYYRGVRVFSCEEPFRYTYNFTHKAQLSLTEDRTLANHYVCLMNLATELCKIETTDLDLTHYIATLHKSQRTPLERHLFDQLTNYVTHFSASLCKFLKEENTSDIHPKLLAKYRRFIGAPEDPTPLTPTQEQLAMTEKVNALFSILHLDSIPFFIAKLEPNVLGQVISGKIYISPDTFDLGERMLASTLYEEYAHVYLKLEDFSREFQNHLLNKLFAFVARELDRKLEAEKNFEMDP